MGLSSTTARRASLFGVVLLVGVACGPREHARDDLARPGGSGLGMRVYRDPVSGAFGAPPAASGAAPRRAAAATSSLAETSAPGGGRMVQLGTAFRSHLVARAGADGTTVTCAPTAAP